MVHIFFFSFLFASITYVRTCTRYMWVICAGISFHFWWWIISWFSPVPSLLIGPEKKWVANQIDERRVLSPGYWLRSCENLVLCECKAQVLLDFVVYYIVRCWKVCLSQVCHTLEKGFCRGRWHGQNEKEPSLTWRGCSSQTSIQEVPFIWEIWLGNTIAIATPAQHVVYDYVAENCHPHWEREREKII